MPNPSLRWTESLIRTESLRWTASPRWTVFEVTGGCEVAAAIIASVAVARPIMARSSSNFLSALPTGTKVESGMSQGKGGIFVNLSNSGNS